MEKAEFNWSATELPAAQPADPSEQFAEDIRARVDRMERIIEGSSGNSYFGKELSKTVSTSKPGDDYVSEMAMREILERHGLLDGYYDKENVQESATGWVIMLHEHGSRRGAFRILYEEDSSGRGTQRFLYLPQASR